MPRPIHFEFPADDPQRAIQFYERVFGWKFQKWDGEQEYWLVATGADQGEPGMDGGMLLRKAPEQPACNTVGVASLEESIARVEREGGGVVMPKFAVPGVGWLAYARDTEGNIFGMMENDPHASL